MPLSKAEGLVLKRIKFGETSEIITLYTKEFGKLQLIAKGARDPRKRLSSILQFLSHIGVVFYLKEERELQLLSQAHLINPFWEIKGDLDRFLTASAGAEFIFRLQIGQQSHPDLFHLLLAFLQRAGNYECLKSLLISFLLQTSRVLGYGPSLSQCIHCKRGIASSVKGDLFFSPEEGGLVCRKCARPHAYYLKAPAGLIQSLNILSDDLDRAKELTNHKFDFEAAYKLLNPFWEYYATGYRSLKALGVYGNCNRKGKSEECDGASCSSGRPTTGDSGSTQ